MRIMQQLTSTTVVMGSLLFLFISLLHIPLFAAESLSINRAIVIYLCLW